jgi:two-component system response regulator YesN
MKIMIADDEVIIRTGLAQVIKWKELGLELLAPAESAEEVLSRLDQERPDILLTDIRMNGITGLELAEKARLTLPDLEVIILSGYDDFIYTQQAIRQNVSDYLLKTSRPEEIIRTVLKVKQRIEKRWVSQSRDHVKGREERQELLKRCIIDGEIKAHEVAFLKEIRPTRAPQIGDGNEKWRITLIAAEGWGQTSAEQSLLLFAIDNTVVDFLPCISFIHKDQVIMAVLMKEKGFTHQHRYSDFEKIERLLKCRMIIVTGEAVDGPDQWHDSYRSAVEASRYKPLIKHNYWDYADVSYRKGGKTICTFEEEKELSSKLLEDDPIALKAWVHRFIQELLEDPEVTPESLEAAIQSVVIAALRWIDRVMAALRKELEQEASLPTSSYKLDRMPNELLFQRLYTIMKLYHSQLAVGKTAHVQKAIAYIEEQLGSDFGLQQVAEHVHLHPNHLSEVFKKETGMKFVDYVTRKKMDLAIQILSTSHAKISDVAARVGFEDVKYFGQMFKKHTGQTPREFRDGVQGLLHK